MKMNIQTRDEELKGHEEFVERRMAFALARFSGRVRELRVRLSDINAQRGGIDKQCLIEASLEPRGTLIVSVEDSNIESAVSRAADRAARQLDARFKKTRDVKRRSIA